MGWRQAAGSPRSRQIDQRAQVARARLGSHPGFDGGIEQGDEEHSLGVSQMRQIENAVFGFSVRGGVEDALNVERLSLQPGAERGGGGDEVVEQHRQVETVFFGIEL